MARPLAARTQCLVLVYRARAAAERLRQGKEVQASIVEKSGGTNIFGTHGPGSSPTSA